MKNDNGQQLVLTKARNLKPANSENLSPALTEHTEQREEILFLFLRLVFFFKFLYYAVIVFVITNRVAETSKS